MRRTEMSCVESMGDYPNANKALLVDHAVKEVPVL
jgi:hypothetical protein